MLTTKLLTLNNNKKSKNESSSASSTSSTSSTQSNKPVSFLIKPTDIQFTSSRSGGDILGHGQFGVVRKAVWCTHTGAKVSSLKFYLFKHSSYVVCVLNYSN